MHGIIYNIFYSAKRDLCILLRVNILKSSVLGRGRKGEEGGRPPLSSLLTIKLFIWLALVELFTSSSSGWSSGSGLWASRAVPAAHSPVAAPGPQLGGRPRFPSGEDRSPPRAAFGSASLGSAATRGGRPVSGVAGRDPKQLQPPVASGRAAGGLGLLLGECGAGPREAPSEQWGWGWPWRRGSRACRSSLCPRGGSR